MLLEAFRNHKRWLMFIAMILVIPSFVVTGIYSYNRMISDDGAIAKVDGESITPQQFDENKRKTLESLRNRMGDNFRANMLEGQAARVALLETLMNERSLSAEPRKENLYISEPTAISIVKGNRNFMTDGKFDPKLYESYIASQGYTDEQFVRVVQQSIARELLVNGVRGTAYIPETLAKRLYDLLLEQRTVKLASISAKDYIKNVKLSDAEVEAYYKSHLNDFKLPDEVDAQYVVLEASKFENIKPTEEEITTFYKQNESRFNQPQMRRASHILIDFSKGEEAAKKLAQEIHDKLVKNPNDFAKLALEYSADPGSAKEGGDLDYFGRGVLVPEFEKAVFDAKKGDIVGPVKTDFGYHIIRVTDVRAESIKPLSEVREQIVHLYEEQERQKRFAQEAEAFTNLVYEQSDTLAPVAEKYKLKVFSVNDLAENGAVPEADKPYLNQHVLDALFADESLREKRNTQAIEVSPGRLVAARVVKFKPAHVQSFDQVKASIKETLTNQKALEMASAEGRKQMAALKSGAQSSLKFGEEKTLSRSEPSEDFALINAALRIDAKDLPSYVGVAVNGDFVVAQVLKSTIPEADKKRLDSMKNEITQMLGTADDVAYMAALRKKHKATVVNPQYKADYVAPTEPLN